MRIILIFLIAVNLLFACALCGGKSSYVHVSTKTYLSEQKIDKIDVVWQFDKDTSNTLAKIYAKNGQIPDSNITTMCNVLEKYQAPPFMTSIVINNKNIQFKPANFKAYIKNKIFFMEFTIPINQTLQAQNSSIEIAFVDSLSSLIFLSDINNATIVNQSNYKIQKTSGIKVIREIMTAANFVKIDITK